MDFDFCWKLLFFVKNFFRGLIECVLRKRVVIFTVAVSAVCEQVEVGRFTDGEVGSETSSNRPALRRGGRKRRWTPIVWETRATCVRRLGTTD